ncbi:MAG: hypothetical protein Q3994_02845 [Prevotella sp.]|nr:hypothetical protein [Prevotella sp.]
MKRKIILLLASIALVMSSCNGKSKSKEAMDTNKDAVESQQENSKNSSISREEDPGDEMIDLINEYAQKYENAQSVEEMMTYLDEYNEKFSNLMNGKVDKWVAKILTEDQSRYKEYFNESTNAIQNLQDVWQKRLSELQNQ